MVRGAPAHRRDARRRADLRPAPHRPAERLCLHGHAQRLLLHRGLSHGDRDDAAAGFPHPGAERLSGRRWHGGSGHVDPGDVLQLRPPAARRVRDSLLDLRCPGRCRRQRAVTATITAVHGQVPADQLGITLVHEHLIADISALATTAAHPDRQWMAEVPVSAIDPQTLGRDPLVCADNCRLDDEDGAVAELEHYARAGGATLVEGTTAGLAPDIGKLARVAARSSVNIIAPTGYYLWFTCQQEVEGRSEHELAETMLRDITEGIPASPATASYPAIRA